MARLSHAALFSKSTTTKEHALSALAQIAWQNPKAQNVIAAEPEGISAIASPVTSASASIRDDNTVQLWALTALAIWHVADGNKDNQTKVRACCKRFV